MRNPLYMYGMLVLTTMLNRSMSDIDGPYVSSHVYQRIFAESDVYLNPHDVAYALDEAVRTLRAQGLPPSRWATFIHLGM